MLENKTVLYALIAVNAILLVGVIYSTLGLTSALTQLRSTGLVAGTNAANNNSIVNNSGNSGIQITPKAPDLDMAQLSENAAATLGSKDAPVTMVEFSDLQCPFCRAFYNNTLAQIEQEYISTGKVYFIYKDFPLYGIYSGDSVDIGHSLAPVYANATRCAGEQGKFWEMHNKIYDEQNKKGQGTITGYTGTDIKNWASGIGLDASKFSQCFDASKFNASIVANKKEGEAAGITGTPNFVIGLTGKKGTLYSDGAQPFETFKQRIEALLAEAQ